MTSTTVPSGDSRKADGSNDLVSEGNADTTAVAGAAGTDITASTEYGSKKSPDGAEDVRHITWHMQALSSTIKQCFIWSLHELKAEHMGSTHAAQLQQDHTFSSCCYTSHWCLLMLEPACQYKAGKTTNRGQAHITGCPDLPLPVQLNVLLRGMHYIDVSMRFACCLHCVLMAVLNE